MGAFEPEDVPARSGPFRKKAQRRITNRRNGQPNSQLRPSTLLTCQVCRDHSQAADEAGLEQFSQMQLQNASTWSEPGKLRLEASAFLGRDQMNSHENAFLDTSG